jgi:hypothetical protein
VTSLDEAFDLVSALDFELPNRFVNHAPMACEALTTLGFAELMDHWVERFRKSMGEALQPVQPKWGRDFEWKDFAGDYRLLPEWMGYFGREIEAEGWRVTVKTWVPRFMPGLVAALFHGVIRTSHAVRAIEVADTPARRAELARALGNWASWFYQGEAVDKRLVVGDPITALVSSAASGARSYVAEPNIFNLHGVTGAMAVHLLAGYLGEAELVAAAQQLLAEHQALYLGTVPVAGGEENERWDQSVSFAAAHSSDSHQVKLVEACQRGFAITSDPGFVLAAQTVTGVKTNP